MMIGDKPIYGDPIGEELDYDRDRFLIYAYRILYAVCWMEEPDPNDLMAAISYLPRELYEDLVEGVEDENFCI